MEGLIDREEMRKHPMMQPLFDENNEEHVKQIRRAAFISSELKFVFTNINEKEFEEFKEHYRNNLLNNLCLDLALAEEKAQAERRRLWIRSCIKGALKEQGKTPTDELLDAATEFCLKACMLPSFNPTRNWWFIEMLCCFCDGKPYERNGYKITPIINPDKQDV